MNVDPEKTWLVYHVLGIDDREKLEKFAKQEEAIARVSSLRLQGALRIEICHVDLSNTESLDRREVWDNGIRRDDYCYGRSPLEILDNQ